MKNLNVLEESCFVINEERFFKMKEIFEMAKTIIKVHRLLLNDALIAATCKYYGISKIATFDEDFARMDFLEVVKV